MNESPAGLAAFAHELADSARAIALRHWRRGLAVERKADDSPVTAADREIEAALRAAIEARFPDHGIAGEEFGRLRPDARFVWSLDPIDGTRAFVSGSPLFGTLVALLRDGAPVLGAIEVPATGERWIGGEGVPAALNGRPVAVRKGRALADAIVGSTSPAMFAGDAAAARAADRLRARAGSPVWGGDCYLYGLLALGGIDLVVECGLSDYDYLAPAAVVRAAGGAMTGWKGEPLGIGSTDRVVAAGDPALHAEAVRLLNGG